MTLFVVRASEVLSTVCVLSMAFFSCLGFDLVAVDLDAHDGADKFDGDLHAAFSNVLRARRSDSVPSPVPRRR
jgi:hypothetical protein